jgi:hypothetical protein
MAAASVAVAPFAIATAIASARAFDDAFRATCLAGSAGSAGQSIVKIGNTHVRLENGGLTSA